MSNLNRYVKIPAQQGGAYNTSNNRLTFDLEVDKLYNLKNSFVEILATTSGTVDPTHAAAVGDNAVVKVITDVTNDTDVKPRNVMLVKNCSMRSSNQGYLEDVRAVNVLQTNLNYYSKSEKNQDCENYKQCGDRVAQNNMRASIFQELQKVGLQNSRNVPNTPIRIKLSDLFYDLGDMEMFSTRSGGLGRVRIELELDLAKLTVRPQTEAEMNPDDGDPTHVRAFADQAQNTAASNQITTKAANTYVSLLNSPYFVGQVLQFTATANGGAAALNLFRSITAIQYNADLTLTLTLNDNLLATGAGETYTQVTGTMVAGTAASIVYSHADLVLQELSQPVPQDPFPQSYDCFSTEQISSNAATTNYQNLIQVEPNAVNMMIMFPNTIFSKAPAVESFRIRVDNEDQTNRDVNIGDPLYYEVLKRTFDRANLPLRNLNERVIPAADKIENFTENANQLTLLVAADLKQTPNVKNVQLNINSSGATFSNFNVYKQLRKELVF